MTYIKKVTEIKVVETKVDLQKMPFASWPEEAKNAAYSLTQTEGQLERLNQELFPLDYLAARVERFLNTPLEDFL